MFYKLIALVFFSLSTILFSNFSFSQVYKCTQNGKVVYQQTQCEGSTSKASEIKIQSTPRNQTDIDNASKTRQTETTTKPKSIDSQEKLSEPASKVSDTLPNEPLKSDMDIYAEDCLNWYKKLLRDPRGAYNSDVVFKNGTIKMKIYATNGFGGYVTKHTACEIRDGKLNDTWTKNLAKDYKWPPYSN